MQIQSICVVWIGLAREMLLGSGWVATLGQWVIGLMLLTHVVEFFVHHSRA